MIQQESGFDPRIVNPDSGATGLMQLMKKMAGNIECKDPRENIMRGTQYLKEQLDKYHGNENLALAAYNAGPDNVDKGKAMSFKETRHFVPQVLAYRDQHASMDLGKHAQDIKAINPDLASMGKVDYDKLKKAVGVKGKN